MTQQAVLSEVLESARFIFQQSSHVRVVKQAASQVAQKVRVVTAA